MANDSTKYLQDGASWLVEVVRLIPPVVPDDEPGRSLGFRGADGKVRRIRLTWWMESKPVTDQAFVRYMRTPELRKRFGRLLTVRWRGPLGTPDTVLGILDQHLLDQEILTLIEKLRNLVGGPTDDGWTSDDGWTRRL